MSSRFPIQRNSNPFCWSCASTLRTPQQTLFPLVKGLMVRAGTYFPKEKRMLFYLSPLIFWIFWPTSTLLRGHLALAIPSLPVADPQILEHWVYADGGSPGQIIPSDRFWSRMFAWRTTALVNLTHRIGFRMFELFRKIDEDFVGSISWNTQPQLSCNFQHCHCTFVTILFRLFARLFINLAMRTRAPFPNLHLFLVCRTSTLEDAIFHRMEWCKFLWGNPCTAVETFFHLGFCL